MKTCFVVSPIGEEGTDIRKRADQVYKYIIDPVCQKCEFHAIRVDQINQVDSITQTILDMLMKSELVIADITGHNPNAFYEMGFRACTGKPMIHLKGKGESIPFDISNIRAFDYELTDLDSVEEVKNRLEQTIKSFNIIESADIITGDQSDYQGQTETSVEDTVQLLPILYAIQDQIGQLKEEIHNKDTETIQAIVKASQPTMPVEDASTAVMKALLPELLKNPSSIKALMEIGEMAQKNKK